MGFGRLLSPYRSISFTVAPSGERNFWEPTTGVRVVSGIKLSVCLFVCILEMSGTPKGSANKILDLKDIANKILDLQKDINLTRHLHLVEQLLVVIWQKQLSLWQL